MEKEAKLLVSNTKVYNCALYCRLSKDDDLTRRKQ